ncbi:GRAM domain-containing protein 4 [Sarcophilus harrisii]|uniref:GRAM domain-containing protein 4 n=1 Tax=Sarcophilus harrisii TaxID=9305 RepID=UPI001301D3E7|nr:GRAM domain-containing protein 4 [Sarcophilus harrisii]
MWDSDRHVKVKPRSSVLNMLKRFDKIRFRGHKRDEFLDLAESPNASDTECGDEIPVKIPRTSARDGEELRDPAGPGTLIMAAGVQDYNRTEFDRLNEIKGHLEIALLEKHFLQEELRKLREETNAEMLKQELEKERQRRLELEQKFQEILKTRAEEPAPQQPPKGPVAAATQANHGSDKRSQMMCSRLQKWFYDRFGEYVEDFRFQPEESTVETEEPLSARRLTENMRRLSKSLNKAEMPFVASEKERLPGGPALSVGPPQCPWRGSARPGPCLGSLPTDEIARRRVWGSPREPPFEGHFQRKPLCYLQLLVMERSHPQDFSPMGSLRLRAPGATPSRWGDSPELWAAAGPAPPALGESLPERLHEAAWTWEPCSRGSWMPAPFLVARGDLLGWVIPDLGAAAGGPLQTQGRPVAGDLRTERRAFLPLCPERGWRIQWSIVPEVSEVVDPPKEDLTVRKVPVVWREKAQAFAGIKFFLIASSSNAAPPPAAHTPHHLDQPPGPQLKGRHRGQEEFPDDSGAPGAGTSPSPSTPLALEGGPGLGSGPSPVTRRFVFQYKVLSVLPGSGMGIAVSTPSTQKPLVFGAMVHRDEAFETIFGQYVKITSAAASSSDS